MASARPDECDPVRVATCLVVLGALRGAEDCESSHLLAGREAAGVDIVTLADAPDYDRDRVEDQPFLEGSQSNLRVIRLTQRQTLPPHTHGTSDLMVYAVEGEGVRTRRGDSVQLIGPTLALTHRKRARSAFAHDETEHAVRCDVRRGRGRDRVSSRHSMRRARRTLYR